MARHDKPYREVGWESLASAIVEMAAMDYKNILLAKRLRCAPQAQTNRKELEAFFRSQWFELLTDIDGVSLMKSIQRMVKEIDDKKVSWADP